MANNNNFEKANNNDTEVKGKTDYSVLGKSPIVFNPIGLEPVSAKFTVLIDGEKGLKQFMINHIKTEYNFKDLRDVTFMTDENDGHIDTFVWLPKNSPQLVDENTLNKKDLIVNDPIPKYSDDLNAFISRFCPDGNRRIYTDTDNNFKGIKVVIDRFLEIFFDCQGFKHQELYKTEHRQKTKLRLNANYLPDKSVKFGRLLSITVEKYYPEADKRYKEPRPIFKA
jgi:hypothetical protein